MAQPYVGEIRMFAGNFAPAGWAMCDGQLLPISENETLFQLIGTIYGGDGQSTFGLPDMRGRIPVHNGTGSGATYTIGGLGGVEEITLTAPQIPVHSHALLARTSAADSTSPAGRVLAQPSGPVLFIEDTPVVPMAASTVSAVGGSQPHSNLQPYLCINFIISLFGIFPSQT